jgi:hypothetical protein
MSSGVWWRLCRTNVQPEHSSTTLNYTYDPCVEIGNLTDIVNYQDGIGAGSVLLVFDGFEYIYDNPGGSMTFTDVFTPNLLLRDSLTKIEITVDDGTNSTTDEITTPLGSVVINSGVDLVSASLTYTITALCPAGAVFVYAGRYVSGL